MPRVGISQTYLKSKNQAKITVLFSNRIRVFDLNIMSLLVIEKHKLLLDKSEYIY